MFIAISNLGVTVGVGLGGVVLEGLGIVGLVAAASVLLLLSGFVTSALKMPPQAG